MPAGISRAASESYEQRQRWRAALDGARRRRHALDLTDVAIASIEEINLDGRGDCDDPEVTAWKNALAAQLPRPLPRAVARVRTPHQLHAALLDWQEVLLDEACPPRREFADDEGLWEASTQSIEPGRRDDAA